MPAQWTFTELLRRKVLSMAANADKFTEEPKTISAALRLQALILATMNEERAEICGPDQPALRLFLEQNAKVLKEIAK